MAIEELLKDKEQDIKLTNNTKWLVWYQDEQVVFDRPYGKKNNRCLYIGDNLEEALNALKEDQDNGIYHQF